VLAAGALCLAALAAATLLGCASTGSADGAPAPAIAGGDAASGDSGGGGGGSGGGAWRVVGVEDGRASYYSRRFDGRRTASGERYDPALMTAAHRTLPFGTRLRVTRAGGGPSVMVRVNDRCGCSGGRIVDLSQAAARKLDMIRAGVVPVRIEILER